jgi:hypothetical protein
MKNTGATATRPRADSNNAAAHAARKRRAMNREQITEQIMRILGWPIAVENDPDGMTRTPIFSYEQRVELGKLRRAYSDGRS